MYESFAQVYDTFMDEVPYDEWAKCLIREMRAEGIRNGLVLDLGCGTGQITRRLAEAGYDMIGVDLSADMLQIAQERKGNLDILYLQQDMRTFELYGTVRCVISTCDSLNYITKEEDLLRVFRLVNNYLDPGGLFLFDMNSAGYYEELCGDNTFAESRDACSFIWENSYDPETRINEYDLTLFVRRQEGLYERFLETHRERAWSLTQIGDLLCRAGLKPEGAAPAYFAEDADRIEEHNANLCARSGTELPAAGGAADKEVYPGSGPADRSFGSARWLRHAAFLDTGTERIWMKAREHGKERAGLA